MPELLREPARSPRPAGRRGRRAAAAGGLPKLIDEYVGQANTGLAALSIPRMRSPSGWAEPTGTIDLRVSGYLLPRMSPCHQLPPLLAAVNQVKADLHLDRAR